MNYFAPRIWNPIRRINVVIESFLAAALLLATIPILTAFGIIFLDGLSKVLGRQVPLLVWVLVWACVTSSVLFIAIAIATCRLYAGRVQPHHKEYRDFGFMRHARHGPLERPERAVLNEREIVGFDLAYFPSVRVVPVWWPVYQPQEGEPLITYRHRVYLCRLPCRLAPFQLWSKTHRWDGVVFDRIRWGTRIALPSELRDRFDLFGHRDAAALVTDSRVEELISTNTTWSLEVKEDRLLAFQVLRDEKNSQTDANGLQSERPDVKWVAEVAALLGQVANSH